MYAAQAYGSNATASYSAGYGSQATNTSVAMPTNTYMRLQASWTVNYSLSPSVQMPSKGMYGMYNKS